MSHCSRCTRRNALVGIGALALGATLPGCAPKSSLPSGSAASCTGGLCLDLTDPANAPLRSVGGAVLVAGGADSIAVIRSADTQLVALSAVCTHEGCLCGYDPSSRTLDCPCHGSSFGLDGGVVSGPAMTAVRAYVASQSGDIVTVHGA
jgi:cytochrome b6-f complex iron-sulfur subunit